MRRSFIAPALIGRAHCRARQRHRERRGAAANGTGRAWNAAQGDTLGRHRPFHFAVEKSEPGDLGEQF
jgi:hypothetical protein